MNAASSEGVEQGESGQGGPGRRPAVSTNVHRGTGRHQRLGSAGSRHAEEKPMVMPEVLEDPSQIRSS